VIQEDKEKAGQITVFEERNVLSNSTLADDDDDGVGDDVNM
jgi:hypothetical protein